MEERFDVSTGDLLFISTGDADVVIMTSSSARQAHVQVHLSGKNMSKARDYFESLNFSVTQQRNKVLVESTTRNRQFGNWHNNGGARIQISVSIPSEFMLDVSSSDGDIAVEDIRGSSRIRSSDGDLRLSSISGENIEIRTSDGDIAAADLIGKIVNIHTSDGDIRIQSIDAAESEIRTSDGSISVQALNGRSMVKSSDGDLHISTATGPSLSLRTSDGDVTVRRLQTASADLTTSDGEIVVDMAQGDVSAVTSNGSIYLDVDRVGNISARSGDGNIVIRIPTSAGFDVDLKGDRVNIASAYRYSGTIEKKYAHGKINGGGPTVQARSSDGRVEISN